MSFRTGVTCAPEDTQKALISSQCGSEDWHTPLPAWSLGLLPPSQCPVCLGFCSRMFCRSGQLPLQRKHWPHGWKRLSCLTRASLTDALFALKVSVETMPRMLNSALAPFKHIFFFLQKSPGLVLSVAPSSHVPDFPLLLTCGHSRGPRLPPSF